jgi:DnaK suppressor protein
MSDIADQTEALEAFQRELALQAQAGRRDTTPQVLVGGIVECCDCGDAVSAERLDALPDAARCVDCQALFEVEQWR